MYLQDLWKNLTDEMVKVIEDTATFKIFLIRFWLHNMAEYKGFDENERSICIEEYIKTKIETNADWFKNFLAIHS